MDGKKPALGEHLKRIARDIGYVLSGVLVWAFILRVYWTMYG